MAYVKNLRERVGKMPLIINAASGALLNDQHQVLLQERADTGNWGFPGGYLEFGETFRQTLVREYQEDAGLQVRPVQLLSIQDDDIYDYPNGDRVQPINAFFLVELVSDQQWQAKPSETKTTKFFTVTQPPHFFNQQHEKMWEIITNYVQQLEA